MHPDAVGDLLHLEGLDRLWPLGEKPRLVVDDRLGRLQERAATLLDRLDEPLGGVDLALDVFAGGSGGGGRMQHLKVDGADPQIRQIDLLEPHLPRSVRLLVDIDVGFDDRHEGLREHSPGLGLEPVELIPQPLDLLDREPCLADDQRKPVAGEVFEVVGDEPPQLPGTRHVRGDLQEQAFLQISGTNARWIHPLHNRQRLLQLWQLILRPVRVDQFLDRHGEVAVDVEVVDDLVGGLPFGLTEFVVGKLVVEVVGEGFGPFGHVGHGVEVAVAGLVDLRC